MKKVIQNRLKVTRKKVSKKWYNYSHQKAVILSNDELSKTEKKNRIQKLIKNTRQNISYDFEGYREEKKSLTYTPSQSPYKGFKYSKTHVTTNSIQKTYYTNVTKYDTNKLSGQINDIMSEGNIVGVAVVLKLRDEEGNIHYYSEYYTKGLLAKLNNDGEDIYNHIVEKLSFAKYDEEYEIIGIYIRNIYEKSKTNQKEN